MASTLPVTAGPVESGIHDDLDALDRRIEAQRVIDTQLARTLGHTRWSQL